VDLVGRRFLDELDLQRLIGFLEKAKSLFFCHFCAYERIVLGHYLPHTLFDFRQVFLSERSWCEEVVVEAVVDGRTNAKLHLWEKVLYSRGEYMRRAVAECGKRVIFAHRQSR
jgi:hypothetical protein